MKLLIPFRRRRIDRLHGSPEESARDRCDQCYGSLVDSSTYQRFRVCGQCGRHYPIDPRTRLAALVDTDTFRETAAALYSNDPLTFRDSTPYLDRLQHYGQSRGLSDAIITGTAEIGGQKIVIGALDFGFLGGSMGVVVGEKIARAAELAGDQKAPLIMISTSGGARMQEGMFSLLQMAKTAAAIAPLHEQGVPFISLLTHPTTGGVLASFASLGDIIIAEPSALIGFAGPRVAEQFLGRSLPEGSHTAEFQFEHGMIDAIVDRRNQRDYLANAITILAASRQRLPESSILELVPSLPEPADIWTVVQSCRDPDRPTTMSYIERVFDRSLELHGDREGADDPAIVVGIGTLRGTSVVFAGFERGHGGTDDRRKGMPMPSGFRKAQRAALLAERFDLPFVTFIDTPGAYPGIESEESGLAWEIAETLALMSRLTVPSVSLVIGEGGSGGALALSVTDRVLMQSGAIFSVIAPEGAATILYRDPARAPELAESLQITAADMKRIGFVDRIVVEPPGGASADPDGAAILLREALMGTLAELQTMRAKTRLKERLNRYRAFGSDHVQPSRPVPPANQVEPDTALPAD